MKEFLSREGRAFTAKNVEEDDAAYEELLARGFRAVPVTVAGDHAVKGFDSEKLRALLAAVESQSDR